MAFGWRRWGPLGGSWSGAGHRYFFGGRGGRLATYTKRQPCQRQMTHQITRDNGRRRRARHNNPSHSGDSQTADQNAHRTTSQSIFFPFQQIAQAPQWSATAAARGGGRGACRGLLVFAGSAGGPERLKGEKMVWRRATWLRGGCSRCGGGWCVRRWGGGCCGESSRNQWRWYVVGTVFWVATALARVNAVRVEFKPAVEGPRL